MWARLVRWLAREHIQYLEYENRELRFDMQRWHDRYEGAIAAVRIFEARHNWLMDTVVESQSMKAPTPIVIPRAGG